MIHPFKNKVPIIAPTAVIMDSAQIIGNVRIEDNSSVWFNAVVRGDVNYICIGSRSNIQDGCVLHVSRDKYPLIIGDDVTVGHNVTLHACVVKSRCLIGMGAVIMDGSEIGENSIIGAGALVTPGTVIPPKMLAVGSPARVKRGLSSTEITDIRTSAKHYVDDIQDYLNAAKKP